MGSFRTSQRLVKENSENIHHNKEQKVTREKNEYKHWSKSR